MLIDKDQNGNVTRLAETLWKPTGIPWGSPGIYAQGYIRFSTDGGLTWPTEIIPTQWYGVSEVNLFRLSNGNILAACRTEVPERFKQGSATCDDYSGLATSISTDNGYTWSALSYLYEYGRHFGSIVQSSNGDVILTYTVQKGYTDAANGHERFGVEAAVSHNNGQTWDLDHRYLLAVWTGTITGTRAYECASQCTSTLLMPDGSILTTFGGGYRIDPNTYLASYLPRDIGLVKWNLNTNSVNGDQTITNAAWNSDTRNIFNPTP